MGAGKRQGAKTGLKGGFRWIVRQIEREREREVAVRVNVLAASSSSSSSFSSSGGSHKQLPFLPILYSFCE